MQVFCKAQAEQTFATAQGGWVTLGAKGWQVSVGVNTWQECKQQRGLAGAHLLWFVHSPELPEAQGLD